MDIPMEALEIFNRFLQGKSFNDVTLPSDGNLNSYDRYLSPVFYIMFIKFNEINHNDDEFHKNKNSFRKLFQYLYK